MTIDLKTIEAIVEAARGQADELARIRASLARLPADEPDERVFWIEELVIEPGMGREHFDAEVAALSSIRGLELKIAPRVAAVYTTEKNQVIVRSYWACPGERLRKVSDGNVRFSASVRAAFRRDLERLADAGYMHAAAHRGTTYWRYGERTKTIVLDKWSMMKPLEERSAIFDSIDYSLSEHAE